ncbi:hypothetical protein GALMADRAFT_145004 [Galerina marginata CBS 339.88]|uniref:Uncharacterized protein n=1 Tax=Galerina marginata (strain CBS 339.88) TaxID=685588 RepID=A0A067SGF5_GALM3|nr:hypothetical protein GALMADRAFT_145004 [Galerina marginata CBS 339.88]
MPAVHDLPTEILCAIFELSAAEVGHIAGRHSSYIAQSPAPSTSSTSAAAATTAETHAAPPADTTNFCALPSQKDFLLHCIALSHVCARWRYVAIDLQALWTRLTLGRNAFVSRNYTDVKATDTTALFLSRSADLPINLDIAFSLDDPPLPLSWIQKSRYEENIRRVLLPHIQRFHSLRLMSSELVITAVLDVFLERNLSSSPNDTAYTPLTHLHLVQILPSSSITSTSTASAIPQCVQPFFPPDLSLVAPHLTTLRVDGVPISAFPRWRLEHVALRDTFLSYQNHFHLFMKTRISRLVLHRVMIPGGLPYVRRLIKQHASSVTTLSLSELRCAGPADEHQDIYTLFFTLSLYHTLRDLELAGLSQEAMVGLVVMLGASPLVVFVELRRLVLKGLDVSLSAGEAMAAAFPAVSEMVLECVKGAPELVYGLWQGNVGIWPELVEVSLDGELVKRSM